MKSERSNFSLAAVAGGLLGFVVLGSGMWHGKAPAGGLTQVGRYANVTFEDGSVIELSEPDTDLDILRRRRMAGWHGHEYRQVFIMADGREMDVLNNRPGVSDDNDDLSTGDHLILAAYNQPSTDQVPPLDGRGSAEMASLQVDGKDHVVTAAADGKDSVSTDVIDAKDKVVIDPKDPTEAPVFALNSTQAAADFDRMDMLLLGDPSGEWNDLRTVSSFGLGSLGGLVGNGTGGTGISTPPIGVAVPEPSTLPLLGVAGLLACAGIVCKRRLQPKA